jgi:hypothetical protein
MRVSLVARILIVFLTISLMAMALCSCGDAGKSEDQILSEMKSPVIVIGKSYEKNGLNAHHIITVIDSTGRVFTFGSYLGRVLQVYNIKDTIK